jgi:hypothetical protein
MSRANTAQVLVLIGWLLSLWAPALAQSSANTDARLDVLFGSHQPYEKFLGKLKDSIAAKNWRAVAALVAYPININAAGRRLRIASPQGFVTHESSILTAKVIAAIESQGYAALFANSNGVMIGSGEIWFSGICEDLKCTEPLIKITAINP